MDVWSVNVQLRPTRFHQKYHVRRLVLDPYNQYWLLGSGTSIGQRPHRLNAGCGAVYRVWNVWVILIAAEERCYSKQLHIKLCALARLVRFECQHLSGQGIHRRHWVRPNRLSGLAKVLSGAPPAGRLL